MKVKFCIKLFNSRVVGWIRRENGKKSLFVLTFFLHFISTRFFADRFFLFSLCRMNNEFQFYVVGKEAEKKELSVCMSSISNQCAYTFMIHHHTFHSKLHTVQNIFTYLNIPKQKMNLSNLIMVDAIDTKFMSHNRKNNIDLWIVISKYKYFIVSICMKMKFWDFKDG